MDTFLAIIGLIVLLVGIAGCILPVIPGPPISYLALLILQATEFATFSKRQLIIFALAAIIVQLLDYIVPVWGTKKLGGTKAGIWGSTIGLVAGVFILPALGIVLGPFGLISILAGPFIGALIGESVFARQSQNKALRAAFGSFMGFLTGTLMKLATSLVFAYYYIKYWMF